MMSRMRSLFLAVLLATPAPAPSFIYEDPAADQAIRRAMGSTYHLDLAEGRRAARTLEETHPDHPVGFVLEAATYWWEAQMDPTRDDIKKQFFTIQDKAISIGDKALTAKKYPTVEIQAYLTSAWGSKARFRLTQSGVGLKTVLDGRTAHNYAAKVYTADPNYTDILVNIGAYNYFTGKIPGILKPFAFLLGAKGDAVLGLQQMRTAAEKGRYARTEAKTVLFFALMKDGAYADSFKVLQGLMSEYPANHVLYGWVAEWYRGQEKKTDGIAYFEKLQADKLPLSTTLAQYALYQKAILQAENDKKADALATLKRVWTLGTPEAALSRSGTAMEKKLK
jgi:hypothetical protein